MNTLQLSNGVQMPAIGLGLWRVTDEKELINAVKAAHEVGYTHFDSAQIYGNEAMLGRAWKQLGVDRSSLFITTKLWNDNQDLDNIGESFDQSLKDLQTDYVDLFLIHFPVTETRHAAWRIGMQDIYKSGRAKAIGVSNYTIKHLEEMKAWGLLPTVNQVELHVYLQQLELLKYCADHGIVVEAYSPLAHGQGLDNDVLESIARKHNKSVAQIMIRWCIEVGTVPLPKSVHPDRIRENFDVFDFALDVDDMQQITELDQNLRTCWDPTNIA